jgi:hypothetical protein
MLALPGVVVGQRLDGSWRFTDAFSKGIGGDSGSGKSTTAAFMVAQRWYRETAGNFELYLGDPHLGARESLAVRLSELGVELQNDRLADDPEAVLRLVERVYRELGTRQGRMKLAWQRGAAMPEFPRVQLVIDEWPALLRDKLGPDLLGMLEALAHQGRKFGIGITLIAQSWLVDASGSTQLRGLPLSMAHHMSHEEYRRLVGRRPEHDMDMLPPGTVIAKEGDQKAELVRVPRLELPPPPPQVERVPEIDLKRVDATDATGIHEALSDEEVAKRLRSVREASREAWLGGLERQDREALELFLTGVTTTVVLRTVYGLASAGQRWTDHRDRLERLVREYAQI